MGVQGERLLKTYTAAAATGTNYTIVYQSGANAITRCSSTSNIIVGVLENGPLSAGENATVCFSGMGKVHSGTGGITRGDPLCLEPIAGRGYVTTAAAATDEVLGEAESASTEDGQIIEVNIKPRTGL